MEFNHVKCRVMNVGRENPHNRYNINKVTLNKSECERGLTVQVSSYLRPRKLCIEARNCGKFLHLHQNALGYK